MAIGDVKKGAGMLVKAGNGATPEVFTTVAKLRSTSFSAGGEDVEITNKDSGGRREYLSGAGTVAIDFSGSGVYDGSDQQVLMESRALANTVDNYQIIFEGGRMYEVGAKVKISSDGEYNGEQTYAFNFAGSGQETVTAET